MPFKPRYSTPQLEPAVLEDLRDFLSNVEDVWTGPWARNQETVTAGFAYTQALLVPAERKSIEPLAARVNENRNQFYQFITYSPWKWLALQQRLPVLGKKYAILTQDGGIYLDDCGNPKKGTHSVGVQRQFCGVLGKTENCQVFPTLVWGKPAEPNRDSVLWPLAMELYLPESWAGDAERREEARVPEEVKFRTKHEIGLAMLDRVRKEVPHSWLGMDAEYGTDAKLRKQLRDWEEPYVVGVRPHHVHCRWEDLPAARGKGSGGGEKGVLTAQEWAQRVHWRTITWSQGSKGPLTARVARVPVRVFSDGEPSEEVGWLLLEQREEEVKAWLCWGFNEASLEDLVRMAHHRWVIEDAFGLMKGELGFDHFEGRTWPGVHHHVSLVMLGLAFLQWQRVKAGLEESTEAASPEDSEDDGEKRAKLPTMRGVMRALLVLRFVGVLVSVFGIPQCEAEEHAPVVLRMVGLNV